MSVVLLVLRWGVIALLALFLCRRYLLLIASILPERTPLRNATRSVAILVAARNEAPHLARLLAALERLDYPAALLQIVLVSDGSTDNTAEQMRQWTTAPCRVDVLELDVSRGKGGALAAGEAIAAPSDLVVVFDADCEPEPGVVQALVGAFDDATVGAAAGYPRPMNATVSMTARYAALERWTQHLVVLAGKDRLGLNPSAIGVAFAVRRDALRAAGGFPVGKVAEDLELSLALVQQGWRLRWVRGAVVRENVVETLPAFFAQRNRWARGTMQSAPRARSLEQLLVSAGYLDRPVLLLAIAMVPFGLMEPWLPVAYLAAPALTVCWALWRAEAGAWVPYLAAAAAMFAVDLWVTVRATAGQLLGTSVGWGRRG